MGVSEQLQKSVNVSLHIFLSILISAVSPPGVAYPLRKSRRKRRPFLICLESRAQINVLLDKPLPLGSFLPPSPSQCFILSHLAGNRFSVFASSSKRMTGKWKHGPQFMPSYFLLLFCLFSPTLNDCLFTGC